MAKTLEITAVPDELHDALVERAAKAGMSISELVVHELEKKVAAEMSPDELNRVLERVATPERTPEETETVRRVLRDVQALPKEATNKEIFALLRHLPQRPRDWTSADVIREYRGPLSLDDPEPRDNGRR